MKYRILLRSFNKHAFQHLLSFMIYKRKNIKFSASRVNVKWTWSILTPSPLDSGNKNFILC